MFVCAGCCADAAALFWIEICDSKQNFVDICAAAVDAPEQDEEEYKSAVYLTFKFEETSRLCI